MLQEMQLMNYSEHTIDAYIRSISNLSNFYNLSPDQLTIPQVKKYLHYCIEEQNCSVPYINQTISALKILYEKVLEWKWEGINISRPRKEVKLPVILTQDEIGRLIKVTTNLKHKSLISLAYSTGMRLNEVRLMKPSDIDAGRLQVKVSNGKGNRQRYTIISDKVILLLRDYYKKYRPVKYLFEGLRPGRPMEPNSIRLAFNKGISKAGIKKSATFHCLRHSFATHLLEQGTNLKLIQRLLGHCSLKSTMVYLYVTKADVDKIINPMDLVNEE
jgi:site-specific recombinase XerD